MQPQPQPQPQQRQRQRLTAPTSPQLFDSIVHVIDDDDDDDDCFLVASYTRLEVFDNQRRQQYAHERSQRELVETRAHLDRMRVECDAMKSDRAHHDAVSVEADARLHHVQHELEHERAHHADALASNRRLVAQRHRNDAQRDALIEENANAQREVAEARGIAAQSERMACAVCLVLYVELSLTSKWWL